MYICFMMFRTPHYIILLLFFCGVFNFNINTCLIKIFSMFFYNWLGKLFRKLIKKPVQTLLRSGHLCTISRTDIPNLAISKKFHYGFK